MITAPQVMALNKFVKELDVDLFAIHEHVDYLKSKLVSLDDKLDRFEDYLRSLPINHEHKEI